jgi:hypothetical protein
VLFGLIVLLVLFCLDAAWVAGSVRSDLGAVRDHLKTGADALLAGDVESAGRSFDEAAREAAHARGVVRDPAFVVASLIPGISDDVRAIRALAESAVLATRAGTTVAAALHRSGWDGGPTTGGLSAGLLRDLIPALQMVREDLVTAEASLERIDTARLFGPVRDAVIHARTEVGRGTELVAKADDFARLASSLLMNGKRYLLVVQNPDEPRGTGGFMGFFGFLRVREGRPHLQQLFSAEGVILPQPVEASDDFKARYARFDGLVDLRQVNFCPDLPTVGNLILQMAAQSGWGTFDGILMVDQVWLQRVLQAIGPVSTTAWPEPITAENAIRILSRDVFLTPSTDEENQVQGKIAAAIWTAFETQPASPMALATSIVQSVPDRHLQLYASDPETEALIRRLGAAGAEDLGRNPLAVTWVGLSSNKAAYLVDRTISLDVNLASDGTATVTTTLSLRNRAAAEPPSVLLGVGSDFPIGTWAPLVSVYLPANVTGSPTFRSTSHPTVNTLEQEFDHHVAVGFVEVAAGRSVTWSVTYTAPGAVTNVDGLREYRLDFLPQPTLEPIPISLTIHLPEGASPDSTSPGFTVNGRTLSYSGEPATPQTIWVRFN